LSPSISPSPSHEATDPLTTPQWVDGVVRGTEKRSGKYVDFDGRISLLGIQATNRIDDGDSPYTALARDEIIFCDTDPGAVEVDLPAGVQGTHIKIINCGINDVTVDPNGTEQLFGAGAGVASTLATGENIDIHYDAIEGWY
jgi:hypothetical protein